MGSPTYKMGELLEELTPSNNIDCGKISFHDSPSERYASGTVSAFRKFPSTIYLFFGRGPHFFSISF
jgi:hypothetical protein